MRDKWRRYRALMSYGSSTAELYGQIGVYAGKFLSGAEPANLSVQQHEGTVTVIKNPSSK